MENLKNVKVKETLVLTKTIFNTLLTMVISQFKKANVSENSNYRENQLYGFGNYDSEKPNLKSDFEKVLKGYINGKYLYNKSREASTGRPIIKISREYRYVFFNYLGFKDVTEFINQDFFTPSQKSKQLELLQQENDIEDCFYVCYYFGEDSKMSKGQVIIYKQWKNIEMKYLNVGGQGYGKNGSYSFFGSITHSEGFLFFDTKFYVGSKKNEGAKFIFFVGKSTPQERNFLIGTYSGFDKYDNTIAGKMILKKSFSRDEMEQEILKDHFDPIISQELNKKRIVVESVIRKNPLLLSNKSPYSQVLYKISGKYLTTFTYDKNTHKVKLHIEKHHLNIKSLDDSLIFIEDRISLINNGKIIILEFSINGLFPIQKTSIYIKSYDLLEENKKNAIGKFTAVGIDNDIISGAIKLEAIK